MQTNYNSLNDLINIDKQRIILANKIKQIALFYFEHTKNFEHFDLFQEKIYIGAEDELCEYTHRDTFSFSFIDCYLKISWSRDNTDYCSSDDYEMDTFIENEFIEVFFDKNNGHIDMDELLENKKRKEIIKKKFLDDIYTAESKKRVTERKIKDIEFEIKEFNRYHLLITRTLPDKNMLIEKESELLQTNIDLKNLKDNILDLKINMDKIQ